VLGITTATWPFRNIRTVTLAAGVLYHHNVKIDRRNSVLIELDFEQDQIPGEIYAEVHE
jgi:hypothetical protein